MDPIRPIRSECSCPARHVVHRRRDGGVHDVVTIHFGGLRRYNAVARCLSLHDASRLANRLARRGVPRAAMSTTLVLPREDPPRLVALVGVHDDEREVVDGAVQEMHGLRAEGVQAEVHLLEREVAAR